MVFFCYFEEATPNDVNKLYFCLKLFLKSVEKKNKKILFFFKSWLKNENHRSPKVESKNRLKINVFYLLKLKYFNNAHP